VLSTVGEQVNTVISYCTSPTGEQGLVKQ
jgi:hypothetical protein